MHAHRCAPAELNGAQLNKSRQAHNQLHGQHKINNVKLTLHVPAPPYDIVESYFVFPANADTLEAVPFRRRQLLPETRRQTRSSCVLTWSKILSCFIFKKARRKTAGWCVLFFYYVIRLELTPVPSCSSPLVTLQRAHCYGAIWHSLKRHSKYNVQPN
jgi:hypothetical protein